MPLDRARELGHPGQAVRVDASGRLDLDGMLAQASGAGLVYVCNPNNPTATVHSGADIESFLDAVHRKSPGTMVLVDEAYHEFVASPAYRSVLARAASDPALVVTRTFSKIHGMAGLRVGYAVATPAVLSKLRSWVDPINMNVIGLSAALASLGDAAYVESQRATNADSRARLRAAFAAAGYDAFDSDANFLMVHTKRDPRSFAAACLARGVQVARPFPPLLEHARITIGTPAEMERATRVFLEVLAEAPTQTAHAVLDDGFRGC
jgi:histidinol-phosphate aminotransferase